MVSSNYTQPNEDGPRGGAAAKFPPSFPAFARRYMRFLANRARVEIRKLELDGELPRARRSVAGVVDETLLRAWASRNTRPLTLSVAEWLPGILSDALGETLEHLRETTPDVPEDLYPEEGEDQVDVDPNSSQWRQCQIYEPHDPDIWEDHFPAKSTTAEESFGVSAEEERELMEISLEDFPAADREALILFALDGFSCDEIATTQKRSLVEVKDGVRAAWEELHR